MTCKKHIGKAPDCLDCTPQIEVGAHPMTTHEEKARQVWADIGGIYTREPVEVIAQAPRDCERETLERAARGCADAAVFEARMAEDRCLGEHSRAMHRYCADLFRTAAATIPTLAEQEPKATSQGER